jgi:hypothetical protein
MATRHLRTYKICGTSLAHSSRPCDSPRPSHDLFTIFCIHVLSLLPRDRIRTNCSKCVSLWSSILMECGLFYYYYRRLILYGLRAHAQRLSGCWDSAGQLMSSRYFGRVTSSDFHLFLQKIRRFLHVHISHSLNTHIPKCLVGYSANIIQLLLFLFFLYGSPRSSLPQLLLLLSRHATIYYCVVPLLCFTIYLLQKHGKKREHLRNVFCACYVHLVLKAANFLARHTLNGSLERVSLRDYAIVLVLGTLSDERRRLRNEP